MESPLHGRTVAAGEQLAAQGGFDLKLKAASENGPTGFYQTYRQSVGLIRLDPLQAISGGSSVNPDRNGRQTLPTLPRLPVACDCATGGYNAGQRRGCLWETSRHSDAVASDWPAGGSSNPAGG